MLNLLFSFSILLLCCGMPVAFGLLTFDLLVYSLLLFTSSCRCFTPIIQNWSFILHTHSGIILASSNLSTKRDISVNNITKNKLGVGEGEVGQWGQGVHIVNHWQNENM